MRKVRIVGSIASSKILLVLALLCLNFTSSHSQSKEQPDSSYLVTFIINDYPAKTPHDASLYLAGDFIGWFPDVKSYKFRKYTDGSYRLTKTFNSKTFLYKITRGSWEAVEGRGHGRSRPNRQYTREKNGNIVYIKIRSWEDITSSTFNAYVYILLFAALQSFLMLFAIRTIRNKNKKANFYLTFQLILMGIALLGRAATYHSDIFNAVPKIILLPDLILFTYAPTFYLYVHHLLKFPLKYPKYWYLHYLPAVIHLLLYSPYLIMEDQTLIYRVIDMELFPVFATSGTIALFFNGFYWVKVSKLIKVAAKEEKQNETFHKYLGFLRIVLQLMAGYLGIWAFSAAAFLIGEVSGWYTITLMDISLDVLWLLFAALVFYLGYYAIKQPEILRQEAEVEKKYKDSIMPDDEFSKVKLRLTELMETEKVFMDPDLTLPELANRIPTSVHTVSRVINEGFEQTFSQFVNEHRVEEFIQRVAANKSENDSFLSLAFSVGFNSKATFNRSFKKHTGTTPRLYFKESQFVG